MTCPDFDPTNAPPGFIAVPAPSLGACLRCAMRHTPLCDPAPCLGPDREDGIECYFVKKPEAAQPSVGADLASTCGICGCTVRVNEFGAWIEYHDCKPVPGAKLDAANAEIAKLRADLDSLEGPSGFGNCTALQGLTLLEKVQKCMRVIRGDRDIEVVENLRKKIASLDALNTQNREARATHRCKICDAKWVHLPDGYWTLASKTCGPCCDNVAMGTQIEPIGLTSEVVRLRADLDAALALLREIRNTSGIGLNCGVYERMGVADKSTLERIEAMLEKAEKP